MSNSGPGGGDDEVELARPEFYEWLKDNPDSEQPAADYWAQVRATEAAVVEQKEQATGYRPLNLGALPPSVGCARCGAVVWNPDLHDAVVHPTSIGGPS